MLASGMLADIVVLSEDPHVVPKIELERTEVDIGVRGRRAGGVRPGGHDALPCLRRAIRTRLQRSAGTSASVSREGRTRDDAGRHGP
jgi:hypothetical protein